MSFYDTLDRFVFRGLLPGGTQPFTGFNPSAPDIVKDPVTGEWQSAAPVIREQTDISSTVKIASGAVALLAAAFIINKFT